MRWSSSQGPAIHSLRLPLLEESLSLACCSVSRGCGLDDCGECLRGRNSMRQCVVVPTTKKRVYSYVTSSLQSIKSRTLSPLDTVACREGAMVTPHHLYLPTLTKSCGAVGWVEAQ